MRQLFYKNILPLLVENKNLYVYRRLFIEVWSEEKSKRLFSIEPLLSWYEKIGMSYAILRRVFRLGVHHFIKYENRYLVFMNTKVFILDEEGKPLVKWGLVNGSRPLNVLERNGSVYFGEYFRNEDRKEVKLYKVNILREELKIVYRFPEGSVRHVHNIQYHKGCFIVLTGDYKSECGIYKFTSDFTEAEILFGGSQRFRAVSVLFDKDFIIIPSDTPLEQNYIRKYSLESKELVDIYPIDGSSFHNVEIGERLYVTTVVEPSKVNKTSYARIYEYEPGNKWRLISSFQKDIFPSRLHFLFRYPEIRPLRQYWNGHLVILGRALRNCSEGLILLSINKELK